MPSEAVLRERVRRSHELHLYAEHTRDVLMPELWRLCVPWRYFAWRKLHREIERRNAYVRAQLASFKAASGDE